MMHRIVYMGTPAFACPALEALAARRDVEVALVVTQPDRPAGRGRRLQPSPVKALADALGLPTCQPQSLRTADSRRPLVAVEPHLIVVAAYGLILGRSVLELPVRGCVNPHASLLPRYRGASPIPAAILSGDQETGVTLMRMERGLDTGPMYASTRATIAPGDTTESLTGTLATVARDVLVTHLDGVLDGSLAAHVQPEGASRTRPLVKADGWVDWTRPAVEIERHVRAMWAWPRAWRTFPDGSTFQIHAATVVERDGEALPGVVVADRSSLQVGCGEGWLRIDRGQLAGGKALTGAQLAANRAFGAGVVFDGERPTLPGPLVVSVGEAWESSAPRG